MKLACGVGRRFQKVRGSPRLASTAGGRKAVPKRGAWGVWVKLVAWTAWGAGYPPGSSLNSPDLNEGPVLEAPGARP